MTFTDRLHNLLLKHSKSEMESDMLKSKISCVYAVPCESRSPGGLQLGCSLSLEATKAAPVFLVGG